MYRAAFGTLTAFSLLLAFEGIGSAQTGQMSKPDNHQTAEFLYQHGQQALENAALCNACHARDYCARCHVNAGEMPAIQALDPDPAVAAYVASKDWPGPPSHTPFFLTNHRALAASARENCTVCHVVEQQCQSCHLGSETLERRRGASERRDVDLYHPLNFLQQHSASAFNQENECASCHNPQVFCQACHSNLGYASRDGRTDTGFHNENPNFQFGHGKAARQGLESCAACHAQQDCLQCHSARVGRNINPHGPEFDGQHLKSKNEGFCLFCHFSGQINR